MKKKLSAVVALLMSITVIMFSAVPVGAVKNKIDFKTNATNYEKFPFKTWTKITKEVFSEPNENLLKLSDPKGVFELRKEIAQYLKRFRNMNVKPEQIVIGSGKIMLFKVNLAECNTSARTF